jgi:tetratricopeptide (TPR) repeat protein
MQRFLCACLLVVAVPALAAAQSPALKAARQRLLRGNIEEAIAAYEALAKDPAQKNAAALGLSRAYQAQGEYDRALAVVETALRGNSNGLGLQARRAELLYLRGRWDEAEKAAENVLAADKQNTLARWVRGQIYRDRGDVKRADSEFRWFTRLYNEADVKDPDDLLLIGLATTEYSRWHKDLADQFTFILNEIYGAAVKADPDLWPANYHAGMLLLEKYNRPEAEDEFDKALKVNPGAAEALVGKGLLKLEQLEIKDAEGYAERALKLNPRLPEALRLRADVHLFSNDVAAALKELETARQVNPRDESTLGRVAACLYFQRKNADLDALAAEVTRFNPRPALFYHELAERLEARRWYEPAETYYKKAMELHPALAWPRDSLGLLYMRLGQEKEARDVLGKAFEMDPFNVRVSNTLKVLRHLEKYDTLPTAHFAIRFDPHNDKALARFMAGYLEEIYGRLSAQFGYQPKGPILIEIFTTHEMFSGRVVALPDLHTIGACTGRMFAMVSPHGKRSGRRMPPFNWARVLRHELVHIFNLEQTHFLVPHWFTEGLAVINEGYPRPQPWNELLLERVPAGEVMDLDTIDLGFIRPRSPLDWHMAYCQSQLYVEYLKHQFGERCVGEMLAAYRDGLDSAEAIARVCKVDRAAFEKGYRAYLDEVVKGIKSKPPEKSLSFTQLKEALKKDPDNLALKARLAEAYYSRDKGEARKLAKEVLARKDNHPVASYVLARLALAGGDGEAALKLLEGALDRNHPEPKVLRELGKLYYNASRFDRAAEVFELGRKVEPYERQWLVELARVYAQVGSRDKQIAVLKELVPTDADDFDNRKRLAKMLLEGGKNDEAERYAKQALEIDFGDKEAREIYEKALRAQNKKDEADRFVEMLGQ